MRMHLMQIEFILFTNMTLLLLRVRYYHIYYQFNFCWRWNSFSIKKLYYYLKTNLKNYAKILTLSIPSATSELPSSATKLFSWFKNNYLKTNPRKYYIWLSSKKLENISIDGILFSTSSHEKLLGVKIDSKLNLRITLQNHGSK